MTIRLHVTIAAVCPIDGVSILAPGTATISYAASATPEQRAAADAALAAFDWSQAAQDAWQLAQNVAAATVILDASTDPYGLLHRAEAEVIRRAINVIRAAPPIHLPEISTATWRDRILDQLTDLEG